MINETKLPKIVPTRETNVALANPDSVGECHPRHTGRPGVFVEVPEHIYPLIGVEGGAMEDGERVTVLGYMNRRGLVQVSDLDGYAWWAYPDNITPAPKTRTVTLEVDASIDPRQLNLVKNGRGPYSGQVVPNRILAIDGEETDDE